MANWTDPATFTNEQIQADLSEVELKLGKALGSEGQIGELEARQWRLRAEQRFRQRNRANEISESERGELNQWRGR